MCLSFFHMIMIHLFLELVGVNAACMVQIQHLTRSLLTLGDFHQVVLSELHTCEPSFKISDLSNSLFSTMCSVFFLVLICHPPLVLFSFSYFSLSLCLSVFLCSPSPFSFFVTNNQWIFQLTTQHCRNHRHG